MNSVSKRYIIITLLLLGLLFVLPHEANAQSCGERRGNGTGGCPTNSGPCPCSPDGYNGQTWVCETRCQSPSECTPDWTYCNNNPGTSSTCVWRYWGCSGGGGGGPTPSPTPIPDPAPIGWHDGMAGSQPVATCAITGWACDKSKPDKPIDVHVYADAETQPFAGVTASNDGGTGRSAIADSCGGGDGNRRFNILVPPRLMNGASHSYRVHAIGIGSNGERNDDNPILSGTPKTMTCTMPALPYCVGHHTQDTSITITPDHWSRPDENLTITARYHADGGLKSGWLHCFDGNANWPLIPDSGKTLNGTDATLTHTGPLPQSCWDYAQANGYTKIAAVGNDQFNQNTYNSTFNGNCEENLPLKPVRVAGRIVDSRDAGIGIDGYDVYIHDSVNTTPVRTTTSNGGYFSTDSFVLSGRHYAVRPVAYDPTRFVNQPKLTNTTQSYDECNKRNRLADEETYECQTTIGAALGCGEQCSFKVTPISSLTCDVVPTPASGNTTTLFNYVINASGGTFPYTYSWVFDPSASDPNGDPEIRTHSTTYTSIGPKVTTVTVADSAGRTTTCETSVSVGSVPIPPDRWWQVISGNVFSNVIASVGYTIKSLVPSTGSLFSVGGTATWNKGEISYGEKGGSLGQAVAVQSGPYGGTRYDYDFWIKKTADYITPGQLDRYNPIDVSALSSGIYEIGPNSTAATDIATITGGTVGSDKEIALIYSGPVAITGPITVSPGGIFILIAGGLPHDGTGYPGQNYGTISIDGSVSRLDGYYIADQSISTGASETPLEVNGGLISWTKINLERDLHSDETPAEKFNNNPRMIYALKTTTGALKAFRIYQYTWMEVAP